MFDVKKLLAEVTGEVQKEKIEKARVRLIAKVRAIAAAEEVLANLTREYDALVLEIQADLG